VLPLKLSSEDPHKLHSSPSIITWNDQVEEDEMGMVRSTNGERRYACSTLVGKPEGKRPLVRPRRRWVILRLSGVMSQYYFTDSLRCINLASNSLYVFSPLFDTSLCRSNETHLIIYCPGTDCNNWLLSIHKQSKRTMKSLQTRLCMYFLFLSMWGTFSAHPILFM
jgi:hypothetical protein